LAVRHSGHTILLTGDLEGAGLEQVTASAAPRIEVLMAPHHGNKLATSAMIQWARPTVVVSCQGVPKTIPAKGSHNTAEPPVLGTWPHGAVTVHSGVNSLVLETYVSKQRWRLP
jgi:competence protein ComEC